MFDEDLETHALSSGGGGGRRGTLRRTYQGLTDRGDGRTMQRVT